MAMKALILISREDLASRVMMDVDTLRDMVAVTTNDMVETMAAGANGNQ